MTFIKQALIFVHRWLGVVLCLLFLLWFPSGFVMMYWDYPSVKLADRLAHASPLDPATNHFSPWPIRERLREARSWSELTKQLVCMSCQTFSQNIAICIPACKSAFTEILVTRSWRNWRTAP